MSIDQVSKSFSPILTGSEGMIKWSLIPEYPTLQAYIELLLDSPEFFKMFWNTLYLVIPILGLQILVGMPIAWGFAKLHFPFKRLLFILYIGLMLMPFQVTMVPHYLVLDSLQLLDTRWAIILPGGFSTFPVFIMYRFFKSIPESLIEASKLDGAGYFKAFFYIGIPLGKGGLLSALVLSFLEYWNMIEQPLTFIKDKSLWPLSLYLPTITAKNLSVAMAASVIMLIPALLIFLWGQDELEGGICAIGLKD